MTAPRPFAEIVEELRRLREDCNREFLDANIRFKFLDAAMASLPRILSRLASREAVFEVAVAWRKAKRSYGPEAIALEVAIDHARALDAATPQGEEKAK